MSLFLDFFWLAKYWGAIAPPCPPPPPVPTAMRPSDPQTLQAMGRRLKRNNSWEPNTSISPFMIRLKDSKNAEICYVK